MPIDFLDRIQAMRQAGDAFAVATVVRAEKPTSAKPGSKAVIAADGSLTGWVGGSCAEPTVRREARKALRDGHPRLVRLCPPENLGQAPQEGVIEIALTCISGGTLEIYIEPHLAQPHLVVVGHLATAEALVGLGKGLGWRVSLMGLDATRERFPEADHVFEVLDFAQVAVNPNTYIVVASHGNYDEDILVAALQSQAAYVTLIASRRRAQAILQYLRETSLTEGQIARLKYPAGLDIGAVTPEEIALSVLAEIVQRRRQSLPSESSSARLVMPAAPFAPELLEAKDPVCGMAVEIATAQFISEYEGRLYYFCASGCKRAFEKEPGKYVQAAASAG